MFALYYAGKREWMPCSKAKEGSKRYDMLLAMFLGAKQREEELKAEAVKLEEEKKNEMVAKQIAEEEKRKTVPKATPIPSTKSTKTPSKQVEKETEGMSTRNSKKGVSNEHPQ